jgi:hypothetical protein
MTPMTSTPAQIASALGYAAPAPSWQTTSVPPVEPARFGKDHWSTFAYVETRAVDHKGTIEHDHMRCDTDRHPMLALAGRRTSVVGFGMSGPSAKYPTFAKGEQIENHDDYDCLDDLVAAGLLAVAMPPVVDRTFRTAYGHVIRDTDGSVVEPGFGTGMIEQNVLMKHATWSLTDKGHVVAAALRQHKANGGSFSTFEPDLS